MQLKSLALVAVFAAGLFTGCDRNNPPAGSGTAATPPASTSPSPSPSSSSSSGAGQTNSPANVGQPNAAEKKHGANPVQGQVDPKQGAQHRDFQQKGDSQGPRSPDTTPPGPKQ